MPIRSQLLVVKANGYRYVISADYFEELDAYCEDNAKDARIVKIADSWTEKSVETLVEMMSDPEAHNSDRRECAKLLLAYAHGHPRTMREVELNTTLSVNESYLQALKEINNMMDRSNNEAK